MPVRLLLVDDHRLVRQGLRELCERKGGFEVIGEAASGLEAVDLACRLRPDVILMDVVMPGMNGIEASAQITKLNPGTRIILLTAHRQSQYVFDGIKAGARAYLLKDADWQELVEAVHAVLRGDALIDKSLAGPVLDEFRRMKQGPEQPLAPEGLTPAEMELLVLLAQGADNRTLMDRLNLSEKTVTNRLGAIYAKLHVENRTQAVLVALRRGWASLIPDD